MENQETVILPTKMQRSFRSAIQKVAKIIDRNSSQFVREAVREKMERLAKENPKVAEVLNGEAA